MTTLLIASFLAFYHFNCSPCTQLISAPVRPPILFKLLVTPEAALLRAGPAELVTFDRPSCALEAVLCAVSLAAVAPLEAALAASEVVEAERRCRRKRDCRRAIRGMAAADVILLVMGVV